MQLNNIEVKRYDMISVSFPSGSTATKLVFPDQPQLRGAKIHGIDLVYTLRDINGVPNINYASATNNISNAFITLYFDGMEGIQRMPLGEIAHIQGNGSLVTPVAQYNNNGILALAGQTIVWTKSYITLGIPAPPAANSAYVIGVYYTL
jgi:hypothetical protein